MDACGNVAMAPLEIVAPSFSDGDATGHDVVSSNAGGVTDPDESLANTRATRPDDVCVGSSERPTT